MAKILFVDHTPFIGGAQLVLIEHIGLLDRRTFDPVVACTDDVPELVRRFRETGADVHIVPMRRLRSAAAPFRLLRSARELRALIRRHEIDLVVANTSRAAYAASVAVIGTGVPLIWSVRDFLFGRATFSLFARIPKRIVGVSAAIRDWYGSDPRGKFSVIYVGTGLLESLRRVDTSAVAAERERWGFGPGNVIVGFMGRLVFDKGAQDLVAAARMVKAKYPDVRFLIAGTGSGQAGDIEMRLHEEVKRDGLDYVVLAGHQQNEALYYSLFDIFVLATRTPEPYATSVVQAMMARSPVVATATGGTPEIVVDKQTGLLVEPGRPDQIATAICALIENPELAEQMVETAHEFVVAHNQADHITRQYEALYRSVLEL